MGVPKMIMSACRWPPFLYSIFLLYWSVALGTLTYRVEWLNLRKKRNDVLGWTRGMKLFFRWKALMVGTQELYREKCMYLCNHRSWADFVVDQYVTEGRSMFMSRWAVFFVFPTFMYAINALKAVLLFKRQTIRDKEAFNNWIDEQIAGSPQTAIAVYPEGHRSTKRHPLPLKTGMLRYAYSRKMPVQVVIGANKEAILSEKHKTARINQTAAIGFSPIVKPEEYATFEEFMAQIQTTWNETWERVFTADFSTLKELPEAVPQFDIDHYPLSIRYKMLYISPITTAIFFLVMYLSMTGIWKVLTTLLGLQFRWVGLGLILGYIALSFYLYSKPVDALTIHEALLKQKAAGVSKLKRAASSFGDVPSEDGADAAVARKTN